MKNMLKELDEDQLKSKLKEMEIKNLSKVEDLEKYLEPILTSYFYRSQDEIVSKRIDFIHESFKEYLLAEYYYESIKSGKMHRLNVGLPSMETMEFLKGLIEVSNNAEAKEKLQQVEGEPPTIFQEVDKIAENAKKFLEDESLILASSIHDEECWKIAHPGHINYEHVWMYRWISLCILKWIKPEEKIDIKKIERMIKLTSHNTPRYLKVLKEAYLVGANLIGANLFKADLSGGDLSGANLVGAKTKNVVVNKETKTKGIVLVPRYAENKTSFKKTLLKKALKAVDPSLRKIILRDNPNLRELLH
jgi:hypothetical protein